jgi:hypothetical protein
VGVTLEHPVLIPFSPATARSPDRVSPLFPLTAHAEAMVIPGTAVPIEIEAVLTPGTCSSSAINPVTARGHFNGLNSPTTFPLRAIPPYYRCNTFYPRTGLKPRNYSVGFQPLPPFGANMPEGHRLSGHSSAILSEAELHGCALAHLKGPSDPRLSPLNGMIM